MFAIAIMLPHLLCCGLKLCRILIHGESYPGPAGSSMWPLHRLRLEKMAGATAGRTRMTSTVRSACEEGNERVFPQIPNH